MRPIDTRLVSSRGNRPVSERAPRPDGPAPIGKLNWKLTVSQSVSGRKRVDDTIEPSEPGALSREFMRQAATDARFFGQVRKMMAHNSAIVKRPSLIRIVSASDAIDTISDAGEPRKDIEPARQAPTRRAYNTRGRKLPAAMGAVLRQQLAELPVGSVIKHYAALPADRPTLFRQRVRKD